MTTLVLGPSLGTSAAACWGPTVDLLRDEFDVVASDLPGHGAIRAPVDQDVTIADLARRVLDQVEGPFIFAGDSVGGAVGLQVMLEAPTRVLGAVLCCTGAKIGTPEGWEQRIAQVRASGTASLVSETPARWFAPGFLERHPDRGSALLHALRDTADDGYVAVCQALATFDVTDQLRTIQPPVIAVAGEYDRVCPPQALETIAHSVPGAELVVLDDVAHLAPAEAPEHVAAIIRKLAEELT